MRAFGVCALGRYLGVFLLRMYQGCTAMWWKASKCLEKFSEMFSCPGCHITSKNPLLTWSVTQKILIYIDLERFFSTVSLAIPTAVALPQCMGVGSCGCPISDSFN